MLFTVECVLQIVAMGFVTSRDSYLRDPWNVLDFIVVSAGLLERLPGMPNVSILRTFRVLRPPRSLTRFQGLKLLVQALLLAIPALGAVLNLLFFCFANLSHPGFVILLDVH